MKIIDRLQGEIAHTETVVVGPQFLFGEAEDFALPGYTTSSAAEDFVKARCHHSGTTYLVEDHGFYWRLHPILTAHAEGYIIGRRTRTADKEGRAGD